MTYGGPPGDKSQSGGEVGLEDATHPAGSPNIGHTRAICGNNIFDNGEKVLPDHVHVPLKPLLAAEIAEDLNEVE